MRFVVLGAGMMGRAVVYDLARTPEVRAIVVADFDRSRASHLAREFGRGKTRAQLTDVRETNSLAQVLRGCDVVVNCTQYNWNLDVMRAALAARVNYVDLGGLYHMTRRQLALDRDFRRIGRIAIPGIGGAPGITNVMARALAEQLDRVKSIRVYNAGADQQRYDSPVAYTFSIATILDELTTRPVHFVNGRYVEKPILSDPEPANFPKPIGRIVLRHSIHSELGTLAESFRDRGAREVFFKINYAPEFVNLVQSLAGAGLTSREPVAVNGFRVSPRDVLLAVLRQNAPQKPAKDVEALRVLVTGRREGKKISSAMEMWASYTARPQFSAVARDTGFAAAIAAVMLARKQIQGTGVQAPEKAVVPQPFFDELKKRGFRFREWNLQPQPTSAA
jgi:lysine 6-dehydrogenase